MKTLTRKSFLKILGTGASITALCALPTIAASAADNDLVELEPTSFISEMNGLVSGKWDSFCFGSNRLRSVSIEDF